MSPRPSFFARVRRALFVLLCAAGVLSGAVLVLHGLGMLPEIEPTEEGQAVSAQPVEPVPAGKVRDEFRALALDIEDIENAATLSKGYDGVLVAMKEPNGKLNYVSSIALAADMEVSSADPGRNAALRAMNQEEGLYTVALVSCLRDGRLAQGELALKRVSGSPWLDDGDMGWLDPALEEVQGYLIGVCRELADLGFDEILLADCCYPTSGDLEDLYPIHGKAETLAAFCRRVQGALADHDVKVSIVGQGDAGEAKSVSGQTLSLLASFGRVWTAAADKAALGAFGAVVLP